MQFLEVVRIEGNAFPPDDVALACDMYLLQVKPFLCLWDVDFFILLKQEFATVSVNAFYLLCNSVWQLCSGVDENAIGACAQLVFAPIDESFADDALLLPSGFCIIPLDPKTVWCIRFSTDMVMKLFS